MKEIKTFINNFLRKTTGYQLEFRRARRITFIRKHADLFAYFTSLRQLTPTSGVIVECGVWQGRSLVMLSLLYPERVIYGFDSFEGFPKGTLDEGGISKMLSSKFSKTSINIVKKRLKECDCPHNTILVKGQFEETLSSFKKKIAFLHVDCDTYNSVTTVLKNLIPLVEKNGIIAFDEYKSETDLKNWPGAAKAVDDYFGDRVKYIQKDARTGKYFMRV